MRRVRVRLLAVLFSPLCLAAAGIYGARGAYGAYVSRRAADGAATGAGRMFACSSGSYTTLNPPCDTVLAEMPTHATREVPLRLTNSSSTTRSYTVACTYASPVTGCYLAGDEEGPTAHIVVHGQTIEPTLIVTTNGADTGVVTLNLSATSSGGDVGRTQIKVAVRWPIMDISTAFNNQDNQDMALCASSCFAATQTISTPPYFSLGAPRAVGLVYHGDRVALRPFLYADVTPPDGDNAPDTLLFRAWDDQGAYVVFTNGDTVLHFTNPVSAGGTVRLASQFDASTKATGVYRYQIQVTAKYGSGNASHVETKTFDTKLTVLSERQSAVARGWSVAGLQRLYFQGDTLVLLAEGDGSARVFTRSCSSPCDFDKPLGDFSVLRDTTIAGSRVYVRRYPDSTSVRFNSLGQMTSATDRRGLVTNLAYDGSGRLTRVYDPWRPDSVGTGKAHIQLAYGTYGIQSITSPGPDARIAGGRVTAITVASDSTLIVAKDPDGDSTRFTYDASKRLERVINRRGDTTTLVYDASSWKLARMKRPRINIDAGAGTTDTATLVDTLQAWQMKGVPTSATNTTAATPVIKDSAYARIADAGGHAVTFTVDRWGQPLRTVDPLGRVSTITRTGIFATHLVDTTGSVSIFSYGNNNYQLTYQWVGGQERYFHYDDTYPTEVDSAWGGAAPALRRSIGVKGRVEWERRGGKDSLKTLYGYDATHTWRLTSTTDPEGHVTSYFYNATFGQPDSVARHGGQWAATRFDGYGRDTATRSVMRPWRRTAYDSLNRVRKVYDGVNANPTEYSYDGLFRTRVKDPKGQVYKFQQNALGWLEREYDSADTTKYITRRYRKDGRLTSRTNRMSQRLDLMYDTLGRTVRMAGTGAVTDTFVYQDSANLRRVVAWNANSRDSILTDSTGRVVKVVTVRPVGGTTRRYTVSYTYDAAGRPRTRTVEDDAALFFPVLGYGYDATTGLLDTVRIGGDTSVLKYDRHQQRFEVVWQGGRTRSDSNTTHHRPYELAVRDSLGTQRLWRGVGFDTLDAITHDRASGAANALTMRYAYDSLGRLSTAEYGTAAALPGTPDTVYGYRPSITVDSTKTYTYDGAGNETSSGGATYGAGNRLATRGSFSFEHDASGNRTRTYDGLTSDLRYEWSNDGKLTKVKWGSGGSADSVQYDYDAFGQLVRITRSGVVRRHFLWAGGHLLAELDSTATKRVGEYAYLPGTDQPLALITSAAIRYFVQDGQGNVVALVDRDSVVQTIRYDAWGNVAAVTGALADTNRLRWKGMIYAGDSTRFYYARARWYDPATRRFISEDPIGLAGGPNLYVFANNDPVNGRDPSGLCPDQVRDIVGTCPGGLSDEEWDAVVNAILDHMSLEAALDVLDALYLGNIQGAFLDPRDAGYVSANMPSVINIDPAMFRGDNGQLGLLLMHESRHVTQLTGLESQGLLTPDVIRELGKRDSDMRKMVENDAIEYSRRNYR